MARTASLLNRRHLATLKRRVTATVCLAILFVGCGGDGKNDVIPEPPHELTGDYAITISTNVDTCGFDLPDVGTVMHVEETAPLAATVDIPVDGQCNPVAYSRIGDTLRISGTTRLEADLPCLKGNCIVQVNFAQTFDFDGGSVTATEANLFLADGGDCSCVILPCSVNFAIVGNLCNGCFDCAMSAQLPAAPQEGLLRVVLPEHAARLSRRGPE